MTFTDIWAKPPKMKMTDWLKQEKGRQWTSKAGELPSDFFYRIISDMEHDGAQITDCLLATIRMRRRKDRAIKKMLGNHKRLPKLCCPCSDPETPNFTARLYKNKAGEIVNHGICRCKCHA